MTPDSTAINALGAIRILRSAGGALFDQLALHGQLAQVEWGEEKDRLFKLLIGAILGFACLLCVMLSVGALVLALCWETVYRIPAATALVGLYGLGAAFAWRRFTAQAALSGQSFAASSTSAISLVERRQRLLRQLQAQRQVIAQRLEPDSGMNDRYPRSHTMRLLTRQPTLVIRLLVGLVTLVRAK